MRIRFAGSIAAWLVLLAYADVHAATPVAAYAFSEGSGTTTADASGNASTGNITGAVWTVSGKNGNALSFDGAGDSVTVPDKAALDLAGNITLSAWIYPTNLSGYRDVIVKGVTTTNNYFLETLGNEVVFGFYQGGWREHITTSAALTTNTWQHIAAVFDNTANTVKIYVNGVERLSASETLSPAVNASTLTLGFGFSGEDFAGRIDDVRIYAAALSAAEVQADMNTAVGGTPPTDTTAPTVALSAPVNGATVSGTATAVSANATDNVGVTGVQFLLDGASLGAEDTTAPYSVNWNTTTTTNGAHTLTARARDAAGNTATSTAISVTVSNSVPDTTAPTVSLTAPANGATVSGAATAVSANAADNVGVAGVQFLLDGVNLGAEDTTAPYSVNWNTTTATNGAHTLTARARDAAGNTTTSAAISVTVSNSVPDTTAPTVSLTAPANGATVSGAATAVSANATDNVGVTGVQFLMDGANLGAEDTTAPYSVNWNTTTATNGAHTLTARARDAAGNTTTSATVSVTVSNAATGAGPSAAYGFSEGAGTTVADVSSNGNTGTITGATWTAAGKYGSALSFDGAGDKVTVADSATLDVSADFTLSAWIYPSSLSGYKDIIVKGDDSSNNFFLETLDNQVAVGFYQGGWREHVTAAANLLPNTWQHVAVVFNAAGDNIRIYVNGVEKLNEAETGTPAVNARAMTIGFGFAGEDFAGRIDDVRIYRRVLTQAEVQTDMNTALSGGTPPPSDTTPPTVSISTPVAGASLTGAVTVSANAADNIGVAGVQFLIDGANLGAEDTSAPYSISWNTTTVGNGAHTVSARARDAAGNTTLAQAVSVTTSNSTGPDQIGQWSALFNWGPTNQQIVPVHSGLLPNGKVVSWDAWQWGPNTVVWDPANLSFVRADNSFSNQFCAGQALLSDGRLAVVGGHAGQAHQGIEDINAFNSVTQTWQSLAPMNYQRWYPSALTLPNGRVLVVSGTDGCSTCYMEFPEIYNPATNAWTVLTNAALAIPTYPYLFVLSNGNVLLAGAADGPTDTRILNLQSNTWSLLDPNVLEGGNAVMYAPDKIMKTGSANSPDSPAPSTATTYVLDMSAQTPVWRQTPSLANARTFHGLTLLPDGTVLATGGSQNKQDITATPGVLPAELWSPSTETWRTMAPMQRPRLYHSVALLLPDARVLIAGGGRLGSLTDQMNGEIYSPPYLFKGARPTITTAPATAAYGGSLAVATPNAAEIAKVSLIRVGSMTHAHNPDQRILNLPFTADATGLAVQAPANANLAPPGYYMLFILNGNGVPSVAKFVRLQ